MSRVADILSHEGREFRAVEREATAFDTRGRTVRPDVGAPAVVGGGAITRKCPG